MEYQSDMQIAVVYHGRRLLNSTTSGPGNGTTSDPDTGDHCLSVLYEYDVCTAIVCAVCFVLGVIYTFFGYRFFKVVAFFTGFIFGSMLVYLICLDVGVTALPPAGVIGIALGAGVICGIITLFIQYVSLFMTGLHLGMGITLFALMFLNSLVFRSPHMALPLGLLGGISLIFALLGLKFQKSVAIFGTSILGSALMVGGLDYYVEKFVMVEVFWAIVRALEPERQMCWYSWTIFACWPFCLFIGAFIQYRVTGVALDHSSVVHGNRIRKLDLIKLRAALYQDSQGLRYRDLYKARRIKGDQILQNYGLDIKDKSLTLTCKSEGTGPESANTTMTQLP